MLIVAKNNCSCVSSIAYCEGRELTNNAHSTFFTYKLARKITFVLPTNLGGSDGLADGRLVGLYKALEEGFTDGLTDGLRESFFVGLKLLKSFRDGAVVRPMDGIAIGSYDVL
jgi:hypothetical protein